MRGLAPASDRLAPDHPRPRLPTSSATSVERRLRARPAGIPSSLIPDGFYLAFYPLVAGGRPALSDRPAKRLRTRPARPRPGGGGARSLGGGRAPSSSGRPPSATARTPVRAALWDRLSGGDVVLLVGLSSLLIRRSTRLGAAGRSPGSRPPSCSWARRDLIAGYASLHSGYRTGDPVDTLWLLAAACIAIAGAAQGTVLAPEQLTRHPRQERVSRLPFAAAAAGFGALLASESAAGPFFPDVSMATLAVLLAGLVALARSSSPSETCSEPRPTFTTRRCTTALTGLPNRALVLDRADRMLARAARRHAVPSALYVDIDGFKQRRRHVRARRGRHGAPGGRLPALERRARGRHGRTVSPATSSSCSSTPATLDVSPELVAERILERAAASRSTLNGPDRRGPCRSRSASASRSGCVRGPRRSSGTPSSRSTGRRRPAGTGTSSSSSGLHVLAQDYVIARHGHSRCARRRGEFFLLYQPTVDLRGEADDRRRGAPALAPPDPRPRRARTSSSRSPRRPG